MNDPLKVSFKGWTDFDNPNFKDFSDELDDANNHVILRGAIIDYKEKIINMSSDNVSIINAGKMIEDYNKAINIYNDASALESDVDNMVNALNNYNVNYLREADYSYLNELVNRINYNNLNENWYTKETWDSFDKVYKKLPTIYHLSYIYQRKVDSYTAQLSTLYDSLIIKDADYTKVDELKNKALNIVNETDGNIPNGSYELYTKEAWDKLQLAIKAVKYGKTAKEQSLVDEWAKNLEEAIGNLDSNIKLANYKKVDDLIFVYNNKPEKQNNWYVNADSVDKYIETIDRNIPITKQYIINTYLNELRIRINALELKPAQGYYISDNYHYGSVEKYVNILDAEMKKSCYQSLYDDKTKNKIEKYVNDFNNSNSYLMNIKINEQKKLDQVLVDMQVLVDSLDSLKKPANYDGVYKIARDLLKLDLNLYNNPEIIEDAFDSINWDYKLDEQKKANLEQNKLNAIFSKLIYKKADDTKAKEVLLSANNIINNASNYTNVEDVKRYVDKINELMSYENFNITSQDMLDELVLDLEGAISNANLRFADYSMLNLLKNDLSINELDESIKSLSVDKQVVIDDYYQNLIKTNSYKVEQQNLNDIYNVISYIRVNGKVVDLNTLHTSVEYEDTDVDINMELKDSESKYSISNSNSLNVGDNIINISIINKDKTIYNYKLTITRKNTSNKLSDLKVNNTSISYKKNKNNYVVYVSDKDNSIDINASSIDKDAKVTVIGNDNIKDGSKVLVEVEDKNGNINIYTLSIKKQVSVSIWVVAGLTATLIFLLSLIKYITLKKKLKMLTR